MEGAAPPGATGEGAATGPGEEPELPRVAMTIRTTTRATTTSPITAAEANQVRDIPLGAVSPPAAAAR